MKLMTTKEFNELSTKFSCFKDVIKDPNNKYYPGFVQNENDVDLDFDGEYEKIEIREYKNGLVAVVDLGEVPTQKELITLL